MTEWKCPSVGVPSRGVPTWSVFLRKSCQVAFNPLAYISKRRTLLPLCEAMVTWSGDGKIDFNFWYGLLFYFTILLLDQQIKKVSPQCRTMCWQVLVLAWHSAGVIDHKWPQTWLIFWWTFPVGHYQGQKPVYITWKKTLVQNGGPSSLLKTLQGNHFSL